jgi:hypothetical protein
MVISSVGQLLSFDLVIILSYGRGVLHYRMVKSLPIMLGKTLGEPIQGSLMMHPTN